MSAHDVEITRSETVIRAVDFHPNLLMRHLDESIVVTDKRVVVRVPRTVFVFFVLGYFERSVTLDNVDTVLAGRRVRSLRLASGLVILLVGLFGVLSSLARAFSFGFVGVVTALVMMVVAGGGLWVVLTSFDRVVGCLSSAGGLATVRVGAGEVPHMEAMASLLRLISTQRTAATPAPGSVQTEPRDPPAATSGSTTVH